MSSKEHQSQPHKLRTVLGVPFSLSLLLLTAFFALSFPFEGEARIDLRTGQSFPGAGNGDSAYTPPDGNGCPGRVHYVEFLNGIFNVYYKSNGVFVSGMSDRDFWSSAGVPFAGLEAADPRIIYDPGPDRWFASAVASIRGNTTSNLLLLAVSSSEDPTGPWTGFAFPSPRPGYNADFPTLGVDANSVFLAAYFIDQSDGGPRGTNTLIRFPKSGLLASPPSISGRTEFGLLPGVRYGNILQPVSDLSRTNTNRSTSSLVLAVEDLGWNGAWHSNLVAFRVFPGTNGAGGASLSEPVRIPVPGFTRPPPAFQPSGNDVLPTGDARFSSSVWQVGDVVYAVHSTKVADRAAIRFYRISAIHLHLIEAATISDPGVDLYYASVAANGLGAVVIGYNGSSEAMFISALATAGVESGGQTSFSSPLLLQAGPTNYEIFPLRWGDYSSTCVDPVDPWRFWTIQELPAEPPFWSMQITELLTGIPRLQISRENNTVVLIWSAAAGLYQLESATVGMNPVWHPAAATVETLNGRSTVKLPIIPDAGRLFRLRSSP